YPVDESWHFGIEVQSYGVDVDHVDVALGEFSEATLLGTLSPPDPLHLITLERKGQLVEVLGDVPGEGHGQVEVQPEAGVRIVLAVRLEPMQGRSEEHTSELQARFDIVCRLLLEKNK